MNIGDKVRLLKGQEQGIVVGFKDQKVVEVEIEDGFIIPVLRRELVVIAAEEKTYFGNQKKDEPIQQPMTKKQSSEAEGVYLAFVPFNDQELSLTIINHSKSELLFSLSEWHQENTKGILAGHLQPMTYQKSGFWRLDRFEQWPSLYAVCIFHDKEIGRSKEPLTAKIQFKAANFFRSKKTAPVINQEAYLIRIDESHRKIDPAVLKEKMLEKNEPEQVTFKGQNTGKSLEIDLHLEKLPGLENSSGTALEMQLNAFHKSLDNALLSNANSLKIIHGVGNGVLRQAIHKALGNMDHIKYFEDSDKEKFGYGATIVHFR